MDIEKLSYKVQMMDYKVEGGHADFIFKVVANNGTSFHIKDRYSSIRSFQSLIRKELDDGAALNALP